MRYLVVLLLMLQGLFAVQMFPMTQTIKTMEKKNVVFNINNNEKKLAASEFEVLRITGHTADGKEIREETDKVVVYPPQFILKANETKKVRVNYTQKSIPKKEEVYRIIASQLPIKVEEQKAKDEKIEAGVKFLFSYEGLLFVGGDGKVVFNAALKDQTADSFKITLTNFGNASDYVYPEVYNFTVTTKKGKIKLDKSYIVEKIGVRILPDESFTFNFKKIKKLKGQEIIGLAVAKAIKK